MKRLANCECLQSPTVLDQEHLVLGGTIEGEAVISDGKKFQTREIDEFGDHNTLKARILHHKLP